MSKPNQETIDLQWVCSQLAPYYTEALQPQGLLALRKVQRDVIVIGPDGRKFRLSNMPVKTRGKEKSL